MNTTTSKNPLHNPTVRLALDAAGNLCFSVFLLQFEVFGFLFGLCHLAFTAIRCAGPRREHNRPNSAHYSFLLAICNLVTYLLSGSGVWVYLAAVVASAIVDIILWQTPVHMETDEEDFDGDDCDCT